ncbi:hypothetical protein BKA81DRAFT_52445 [Phyllosticta paracitricarpa]
MDLCAGVEWSPVAAHVRALSRARPWLRLSTTENAPFCRLPSPSGPKNAPHRPKRQIFCSSSIVPAIPRSDHSDTEFPHAVCSDLGKSKAQGHYHHIFHIVCTSSIAGALSLLSVQCMCWLKGRTRLSIPVLRYTSPTASCIAVPSQCATLQFFFLAKPLAEECTGSSVQFSSPIVPLRRSIATLSSEAERIPGQALHPLL